MPEVLTMTQSVAVKQEDDAGLLNRCINVLRLSLPNDELFALLLLINVHVKKKKTSCSILN